MLATNRKLAISQPVPWETHPVYEHGFFRRGRGWALLGRARSAWRRWYDYFFLGLLYSFVGLIWVGRFDLGNIVQQIGAVYPPRRPRSWLIYVAVFGILAMGGSLGFVASGLRPLGHVGLRLARRIFGRVWRASAK